MKKNARIVALVLAAGYSSRMDKLKPLLPMKKSLVIENAVNSFIKANITDIRVVLGYRAGEIIPFLSKPEVQHIINDSFKEGMYSSVKKGVQSFERNVEAFFLLPGDFPIIHPETIKKLAATYYDTKPQIIYPCFQGFRGHPPLISTEYKHEIINTEQPEGMQGLLRQHEMDAVDIEVSDLGILIDINTPFEYQHLLKLDPSSDVPSIPECYDILKNLNVPERIIRHSQKVAATARQIALCLNNLGFHLDLSLIEASGLLHDIAKGQSRHDRTGSEIILKLGYPKVAAIVGCHVNIDLGIKNYLDEAEIIYLADKLVQGNHVVSLQNRFTGALIQFKDNPEIIQAVLQRFHNAEIIQHRVEKVTGTKILKIIKKNLCE